MTGLLICAALFVAAVGWLVTGVGAHENDQREIFTGLALIAAALYLAWRAGGAV